MLIASLIRWDAAVPLASSDLAHTLGYDGYESYLHELAALEYALPEGCLDQHASAHHGAFTSPQVRAEWTLPRLACKCSPRRPPLPTGT
jgi:hypothetical protein